MRTSSHSSEAEPNEKEKTIKEKEMKIPQTYRVGLALLACTLVVGVAEAQQAAPPIDGVIGKLQSFDGKSLDVMTPSHITPSSYVGVASTEANGKQVAKQVFIFPAELSGAAEGSVLTDPPGATTHSRMTNGSVSRPASHSRMTNGTVQKSGGTTLVLNYQDGSQTISVPPNVPVTEVAPQKVTFSPGDVVYATTQKLPDGTLVTDKIFQFIPAESH
jgi:hypothetical protein